MGLLEDAIKNLHVMSDEESKEYEYQERVKREIKDKEIYDRFLKLSNMPDRYFESAVGYIDKEAYTFIAKKKFAILKGHLGVGKTYTSCAYLIDKWKKNRTTSYFLKCYKLKFMEINDLKALIRRCEKVQVLLVDDLGLISGNNFIVELISAMLLSRIDNNRKTIITVNENLASKGDKPGIFDDRIANKLMESFAGKVIKGINKRKKAE